VASGLAFVGSLGALLAAPDPQRWVMRAQPGELTALQALAPLLLETAPWLLLALLVGELLGRRRDEGGDTSDPTGPWLATVALSLPLLGVFFTLVRALLDPLCGAVRFSRADPQPGSARRWIGRAISFASRAAPRATLVLPSYVVGVVLAIAIEAIVPGHGLDLGFAAWPLVVLLAVVLRIGAAGVTVVAALLVHKGLSLSSALVFIGLTAHLSSAERAGLPPPVPVRALVALGVAVIVMHLWGPRETPPLHALAAHPHPLLEWLAAAVITTWALFQLVTSGPRIWFQGTRPPSIDRPADGPSPEEHHTP
jgi:hypothetical protein